MKAATFRSAYVSYIATNKETLMIIRINTHFSIKKTQSIASNVRCIIGTIYSVSIFHPANPERRIGRPRRAP
jgi:hypothetical protein